MSEDSDDNHPDRGRIARLQSLKRRAKQLKWLEADCAAMPDGAERAAMQVRLKELRSTMTILMERSVSGLRRSRAH
jgi:hypothetical protein